MNPEKGAPSAPPPGEAGGRPSHGGSGASLLDRAENAVSIAILCGMALLPILEIIGRWLWRTGIPGSTTLVQHGTLWIGFLGGAITARDGSHLSIGALTEMLPPSLRKPARIFTASVSASVSLLLCSAGFTLVRIEWSDGRYLLPFLPVWLAQAAMPFGFALIAWRQLRLSSDRWGERSLAAVLAAVLTLVVASDLMFLPSAFWASIAVLGAAVVLGAPLFTALGGLAVLLFRYSEVPIAAIPAEMYRLVTSPTLPTIPLFTFAGYILTAGNTSTRLVRLFRAMVGWMPGAIAVVTVLVCTFFTTFTGASGVTIVALGGILLPALIAERYPERFSFGLLTASGSLGLLFPPCLPVILYAVVGGIPVDKMFIGGVLPGILLVLLMAGWGVRTGVLSGARRTPFSLAELRQAAWDAKWDILLPVIVLLGIFGGFATIVEAAAMTVLYAFFVEAAVHRDVGLRREFPRAGTESARLVGGFLILFAVATGLTAFLVDAGVPQTIFQWVRQTIHSRVVFLLILNIFLLVVGCFMHIFSAIVVVVPIIAPLATAFDVHPVHLGIIFLANLELGFLMPPAGMNLFLSAYRFDRSLADIYRSVIPFLLILLLGVLAITYIPFLTTVFLPE